MTDKDYVEHLIKTLPHYRGVFGYIAPVWVVDPNGECIIMPRHIGYLMMPIAEVLVQAANYVLSWMHEDYVPHFPVLLYGEGE